MLGDGAVEGFPRLYAAASLKRRAVSRETRKIRGFPRLYAAASLKLRIDLREVRAHGAFSAALCRGLIEARALAWVWVRQGQVFRGFMPRPH